MIHFLLQVNSKMLLQLNRSSVICSTPVSLVMIAGKNTSISTLLIVALQFSPDCLERLETSFKGGILLDMSYYNCIHHKNVIADIGVAVKPQKLLHCHSSRNHVRYSSWSLTSGRVERLKNQLANSR